MYIDLKKRNILIDPPEKGKSRKERIVFFGEQTKEVIEKYLEFRKIYFKEKDSPWLFPSNNSNDFLTRRRVLQIMHDLADKMKIDINKVISTVKNHGNTSAASIPLALENAIALNKISNGNLIGLHAIGGGLSWGASIIRIGKPKIL